MVDFYDTRIGRYFRNWKNKKIFNKLKSGDIVIDCGANVGKITQRMARPGVTVYAFEPDPNAFEELSKKFKDTQGVFLINKAVSDHYDRRKLYFNDRYKENPTKWSVGSSLLEDKPRIDISNFIEVEVVDIIDFIKNLDKPVALLKMDIEGEEVRVLNSFIDRNLITKIGDILVETHERFPTLKESTENLRKRIKTLNLKNIDLDWA